jgi:hypothetical protein
LACQFELFVNIPLMSKKMKSMLLTLLFTCFAFFGLSDVGLVHSSPNACLIIGRVSVALLLRFAENVMLFLCRIHREIASGQMQDAKQKDVKITDKRQTQRSCHVLITFPICSLKSII